MMKRVLVADDAPGVTHFLEKGLQANGYETAVVHNGEDAIEAVLNRQFDLMILDLELPMKHGITVLDEIRRQGIPLSVIVLSSHHGINHKVTSFNHGADDYITKPFQFAELLARVRARLHNVHVAQSRPSSPLTFLSFKGIELNLRTREVRVNGNAVQLSSREFLLAEAFVRNPGQIMSREKLLDDVWGYTYDPGSNIVDVYVGYLRKKLGRHLIETIRGTGYRFTYE
ncbi:response regulator transcription factor [Leptothoe sp. ISB3NOV94-8A]|nr:response regulator transcription factor [Leptothoe sp. LEGE 181152]